MMPIAMIVLVIAILGATQWMRTMEARFESLNAQVGELERTIQQMKEQGYR